MKKAIKATATKKSEAVVKKAGKRGRPKKVVTAAAGASNGRPLTAAKILKQQIKATQDFRQMHDGLLRIVNDDSEFYATPVKAFKGLQRIAKDSLKGVRL